MSSELALSTDAPLATVLDLLKSAPSVLTQEVEVEDGVVWLKSRTGKRIVVDAWPKLEADELETLISVDGDETSFQEEIFRLLHTLPYECRSYDELDNETTYRPENALPAEPWTPS